MSAPIALLTLEEVARSLRVSKRWVEEVVAARRLRSFHLGRHRRITVDALGEFVRQCEQAETGAAPQANPLPAPSSPTSSSPPRVPSFEALARELTGTSGSRSGSHSRQRVSRRSTSSTPGKPSTSGGASSKDDK